LGPCSFLRWLVFQLQVFHTIPLTKTGWKSFMKIHACKKSSRRHLSTTAASFPSFFYWIELTFMTDSMILPQSSE
jgi:hypothetical protein